MAVSKMPNISKDLLWTNSNPTASFSAQTISVDLSAYSEIEIEFKHATVTESFLFQKAVVPSADISLFFANSKTSLEIESRAITVTSTSVEFGEGRKVQGSALVTDNTRIIPTKIYGIK